ncbi:MAG: sulfatase-like hydrolase/transferase [Candidatus Hodarchaeota archaeon]
MKIIGEKVYQKIRQNVITNEIYNYLYSIFFNLKKKNNNKKEFYSRISEINIDDYIEVNKKPDLNIVIIIIDCLRYSELSSHGYHLNTTPFLDSFPINLKAISTSPHTYTSVPSILTGLYPHNHGAIISGRIKNFDLLRNLKKIKKDVISLPEILYFLGYEIYFASSISTAYYPFRDRVLYPKLFPNIKANIIFKQFKKWVLKKKSSFFAYLHLYDLHGPINPPIKYRNYFAKVERIKNIQGWDFLEFAQQNGKEFEKYKKNKILLYDNTLRYLDSSIKKLYSFFQRNNLLNSTIFVITADHGEEFWEYHNLEANNFYDPRGFHGVGHGHNVFNNIIEVPLLLSGPGIPKETNTNVSTADIMPTILELLRIKYKIKFDGKNIFKEDNNKRLLLSEAISFGFEKKALIYGRYKLIYSKNDNISWIFDLKKDPNELNPINDKEINSIFLNKLLNLYTISEKNKIHKSLEKIQ